MKKRIILVFCFALLCFSFLYAQTPLKVTFIDVGHGDCILIQTPDDGIKGNGKYEGEIILIDGGKPSEGRKVIIPYLKSHGINTDKPIDFMIMPHADEDHVGGLIPVIQAYQVNAVLDPGFAGKSKTYKNKFCKLAEKEPNCKFYKPVIGTLVKEEGDNLDWGSEFEVKLLSVDKNAENINDSSIVLWIKYGDVSFLLPGDAGGKERNDPPSELKHIEKKLVKKYGRQLNSTFLKAPHHGSESASTNAFIEDVSPQYVIICAGNKRFNGTLLPVKAVIQRYEKKGAKIYRTDRDDQKKDSSKTSGDDSIVITSDGSLKNTKIGYED